MPVCMFTEEEREKANQLRSTMHGRIKARVRVTQVARQVAKTHLVHHWAACSPPLPGPARHRRAAPDCCAYVWMCVCVWWRARARASYPCNRKRTGASARAQADQHTAAIHIYTTTQHKHKHKHKHKHTHTHKHTPAPIIGGMALCGAIEAFLLRGGSLRAHPRHMRRRSGGPHLEVSIMHAPLCEKTHVPSRCSNCPLLCLSTDRPWRGVQQKLASIGGLSSYHAHPSQDDVGAR